MSRKSKRILLTLASAAVGAACGAAVYFIRKGKADLETDFDDFKDEFEEEEPAPAERTYTTRKRKVRRMLHRIWNLAMMKRILARKKQQKKLQAPQKKHRLLRIVKFLRRKKAK